MIRPLRAGMACLMALTMAAPTLLAAAPAMAQERQTLNVQGADIRAFIQDIARLTGRTFIVDPAVTGTVTVSSDRPLTRAQTYEVFLSTLRANGLVVIPTNSGAYRIAPAQGAAQGPSTTGTERFVTEVFTLKNIDAASAAETIRPLVGASGQVLANPAGNTVVVADFADNMGRIRSLIARIDVDTAAFEVVTLENSSAAEIAAVLDEVLAPPGGQAGQGMVSVTPVVSSNSVVLRGDAAAVARVRGLVEDLDSRAQSSADVEVVFLQHADADQLLPVLQQLVGQPVTTATTVAATASESAATAPVAPPAPVAGQRASVTRFPGANALVIQASPETQRMLADVIARLDVRRQQVQVEAVVVELSDEAVRQLGVQWAAAGEDGNPLALTNYSDSAAPLLPIAGAIAADGLEADDPLRDDLRNAGLNSLLRLNGFVGGGVGSVGDILLGAVVNAVRSDSASNILSTPSVMTLDNQEATFLVGQEVPVTTGEVLADNNANPFRTTQRQDIGVKLVVRPQINAGGSITLHIRQEVSSIDNQLTAGASDLVLNKRELETTLIVDDGDIAVAGGLLSQNDSVVSSRVPVLGDIPGIGVLFRSTSREGNRTNLVIFIRPTIVRSPADAQRLAAQRWDYARQQQIAADPAREPSLDALLRDYMRTQPPVEPQPGDAPLPGN
ncbi:MAG TPA: type II secretion system secretin GspD [Brevundimonas sp.]